MSEWTDSARNVWAEYTSKTTAALQGSGADPQEVLDDLKRHVEEEISAAKLSVVTGEDLRKILAKIGPPDIARQEAQKPLPSDKPASSEPAKPAKVPGFFLLFFGVVMPVITIGFELVTGASASSLFDPIPTWLHIAIVALVPIGNLWMWRAARRRQTGHARWLGWLNGFVLGVCIYYSLLYILFVPFACIAVIFFGIGLIPLTPYMVVLATPLLRHKYCRVTGLKNLPGYVPGVSIALVTLLLLQLPETFTFYGLSRACSEDKPTQAHGLKVLRAFGDRTILLRACYGSLQSRDFQLHPINLLALGENSRAITAEAAREVYYRVTGEAFNSVPPPKFYTRAGRWSAMEEEFAWDDGLGGDQVAGRIKGLSLAGSRIDVTTEPEAGLSYCEWTMEFKNVSAMQREARAQIALPPGAVVSRVTLWVDGEEREAAFGGRSQTRKAYQEVAVQQRRDPLLVTTCGPDRVLIQCFPIPPSGGTMKIRLGITAPLILDTLTNGNFVWPHFSERNFGLAPGFKHTLWLAQPGADQKLTGTHEDLLETNLSSSLHTTLIHRPAEVTSVWAPTGTPGQSIQQTIQAVTVVPPTRIVLVLDGSEGMKKHLPEIARELDQIPETAEVALMIASDQQELSVQQAKKASAGTKAEFLQQLREANFVGGQDNLPALETAWDLADGSDQGDVVWIHLPEPFLLSSDNGLAQRLERNLKSTRLHEIQLNNGPDRVLEKLDGLPSVEHIISLVPGQTGLGHLLDIWAGRHQTFAFVRQLTNDSGNNVNGRRGSKHVVRLWAHDESIRLAGNRQAEAATKLAVQNQLVTPVSGAVVLETKAQYDRHGLTPADPNTVPAIPEPAHLTIVALAIALYALKRRQQRP